MALVKTHPDDNRSDQNQGSLEAQHKGGHLSYSWSMSGLKQRARMRGGCQHSLSLLSSDSVSGFKFQVQITFD